MGRAANQVRQAVKNAGDPPRGVRVEEQGQLPSMAKMFKALGIDRSCLLAVNGRDEALEKSARNIDRTTLTTVAQLNAWDILRNRTLLVTREGLQQILA